MRRLYTMKGHRSASAPSSHFSKNDLLLTHLLEFYGKERVMGNSSQRLFVEPKCL